MEDREGEERKNRLRPSASPVREGVAWYSTGEVFQLIVAHRFDVIVR